MCTCDDIFIHVPWILCDTLIYARRRVKNLHCTEQLFKTPSLGQYNQGASVGCSSHQFKRLAAHGPLFVRLIKMWVIKPARTKIKPAFWCLPDKRKTKTVKIKCPKCIVFNAWRTTLGAIHRTKYIRNESLHTHCFHRQTDDTILCCALFIIWLIYTFKWHRFFVRRQDKQLWSTIKSSGNYCMRLSLCVVFTFCEIIT